MKKTVFALALMSLFFFPGQIKAQFFKNLGKALESVGKTLLSDENTNSNTNNQVVTDGTKVINNLPGFAIDYKGVVWQDDYCGVYFVLTNKSDKVVKVYSFERMKTFDADGNQYNSRSIVGNQMSSGGNGDFEFEPGVPVKCVYALYNLPTAGTTMSLCQLRLETFNNGYKSSFIEFRNVPIPPKPAKALKPFKGVWNMKTNNAEGKLTLDFYGKSVSGMDTNGNNIKCYGTIYVNIVSGANVRVDECPIIAWQADNNKAIIKFIGGRDENTYQAVLTYNPSDGKMTITDKQLVGNAEYGTECYVYDNMVFSR